MHALNMQVSPTTSKYPEAYYGGVSLRTMQIKYPYANPLFAFEDGKITRHLEDPNYQ